MATHIKTDRTETEVSPKEGKTFSLKELQAFVGGYIQMLTTKDGKWLVVNEEGIQENLLMNEKASDLYGLDIIVGDVLVCDKNELD
jgi:hypothetical protein